MVANDLVVGEDAGFVNAGAVFLCVGQAKMSASASACGPSFQLRSEM